MERETRALAEALDAMYATGGNSLGTKRAIMEAVAAAERRANAASDAALAEGLAAIESMGGL